MINPKFATAMIILLLVVAGLAVYSIFGTSFASMLQSAQPAPTTELITQSTIQATTQATIVAPLPPTSTQEALPTQEQPPAATPTSAPAEPTATQDTPTSTGTATETALPTEPPTPEQVQTPTPAEGGFSRTVNGKYYDAYVDAATKLHQYYHYTCEFDAAWVILKTNGIDVALDDQIAIVGIDNSIEPSYEETITGFVAYGGDILHHYSGDYETNFLARSTGNVIRRIFEHYGLTTTAVHDRDSLEAALQKGQLVWIKTTADFKPGKPLTWIMLDGTTYDTVLGNDHAAVVMGYSDRGVLIRDVLGPTSTNGNRKYEYEVTWETFMAAWGQQQYDGIAVGK